MSSRPSPLPALRALAERTVTVADIVTAPIWQVRATDPASEVLAEMTARDFDVAAIEETPIRRFVRRVDLEGADGATGAVARPIDAAEIVSYGLPLADLIDRLGDAEHLFVMDNEHIRWLVTHADLQAPAVGLVGLAYLIAIEAALSELVPHWLGEHSLDRLAADRRAKAEGLFVDKRATNDETTLADCLYFEDWMTLAESSKQVRRALGAPSIGAFEKLTSGFRFARNELAHGGTLLNGRSSNDAVDLFRRLRSLAERAWTAVDELEDRWDAYIATEIVDRGGGAWTGPGAVAIEGTWYVLTAANPGSRLVPDDVNSTANIQLVNVLRGRGLRPEAVEGRSSDGSWSEPSVAVNGIDAAGACELGDRFGQAAIFELTAEKRRVLRCPDGQVMRERDRRAAVTPPS